MLKVQEWNKAHQINLYLGCFFLNMDHQHKNWYERIFDIFNKFFMRYKIRFFFTMGSYITTCYRTRLHNGTGLMTL